MSVPSNAIIEALRNIKGSASRNEIRSWASNPIGKRVPEAIKGSIKPGFSSGLSSGMIVIKASAIIITATNMSNLSAELSAAKLNVKFGYSSGDTADKIIEYAEHLCKAGDALSELILKTSEIAKKAADTFVERDERISEQFKNGG